MKTEEFAQDSPLGLGWLLGHIPLAEAITALAVQEGLTDNQVRAKYQLPLKEET